MDAKEKLLWSIALPGFGQLLNGRYLKGFFFILCEVVINVQSNLNEVIMLSFNGEIGKAIQQTDYQWLLFYPCLYFFAMWDAFKDAGGGKEPYSFLPFLLLSYFLTIAVIYSARFELFGVLFGPVWFPIICVFPGVLISLILKKILNMNK
ncbi:hypothetical protein [Paenisporosarcina sp. TG-14]|uniref:hypothetical protein n=1 Tax=Paenisporosarcina sp. TG-14 TaxID=1231057 RepID=UPI000378286E|nr:hypothetical protein [Paenisporosarcina sp. TG-14]